ncbi:SH3 domain-containing protein [Bacillus pseudomycoides]|uniref:SH3 domain-containing protein n=1 Tax=Bacillus pseudomycoides TaxID=64104 RepID=UPI000BEDD477|nr:SH3 domain-containing protein [Bacillus pseudomycoides]PED06051.1 anti-sigma factor [Bacillus pseudomycoides]PEI96885.1 anti-sigma factor [Bacillus pseudomycoides]PEK29326.1 anti-sigma factor [Bacillus pseudomycoides]PEM64386.1 anti-sigma factor [Bacillus pseudomycoides]PEO22811.1 anti-sigma factor [Bacillus pseudomycoides]
MNNDRKPDWYKELKGGPMKQPQDEEELIYKIKQSIYQSRKEGSLKIRRPFRIKTFTVAAVLVFTAVLFNFQQFWLGKNEPPVQSSTQIEVKMKDESNQDQSLKQFMDELNQNTSLKNKNDLYRVLDEEFVFKGEKYSKNEWKFDDDIFHDLQVALVMGGEFVNDTKTLYKIPSGLAESNQKKQERFLYATVVGEETKILTQPKPDSRVLYRVSNETVKAWIPEKVNNDGYIKITTMNGYTGYVKEDHVSIDIQHSFIFEKQNDGMWKIKSIDSIW